MRVLRVGIDYRCVNLKFCRRVILKLSSAHGSRSQAALLFVFSHVACDYAVTHHRHARRAPPQDTAEDIERHRRASPGMASSQELERGLGTIRIAGPDD